MEQHKILIHSLVLKLQDQCDHLIPELCQNFNFVPSLEINLNNFALNFDNLPQSQYVQLVQTLAVKKNKFLFYPLVSMATNLRSLHITFKEFTNEIQDLKPLQNLRNLKITCISDSSGYFDLKKDKHFRLEFFEPKKVDLQIEMHKFNLELKQIFNRFSYRDFPINSFEVTLNKLKFVDDQTSGIGDGIDRYKEHIIYEKNDWSSTMNLPYFQDVKILNDKMELHHKYSLNHFSKN